MKPGYIMLVLVLFTASCKNPFRFFEKKTAHEKYAEKIEDTELGKQWIAVSKKTLANPHTVDLPYKLKGYFSSPKPRALTLEFTARQGEKIMIELNREIDSGFVIYADLFQKKGTATAYIQSADTLQPRFSFIADNTATYLLRLQPELFENVSYDLDISIAPSLAFPVSGNKANAGSFWGDDRDAGRRRHEGVDIFSPRLTPAIAAADGHVTGVQDGGIGGKTVWMRVAKRDITLYYAHLDEQLVTPRQRVKTGDTLGLVGNTGNARFTSPHLHFGIYTHSGPVDPWPFINKNTRSAGAVKAKELDILLQWKNPKAKAATNEILYPLALTNKYYIAERSDGTIITAPFDDVRKVNTDKQGETSDVTQQSSAGR